MTWERTTLNEKDYVLLRFPNLPVTLKVTVEADTKVGNRRVPHWRWAIMVNTGRTPMHADGRDELFTSGLCPSYKAAIEEVVVQTFKCAPEIAEMAAVPEGEIPLDLAQALVAA